jgi:hypothetical protein
MKHRRSVPIESVFIGDAMQSTERESDFERSAEVSKDLTRSDSFKGRLLPSRVMFNQIVTAGSYIQAVKTLGYL